MTKDNRRKKALKKIVSVVMVCITVIFGNNLISNETFLTQEAFAASTVTVNDFKILDAAGVPVSQTNIAVANNKYQLWVNLSLQASSGSNFTNGEQFRIPMPRNDQAGSWISSNSSFVNFSDTTGAVLGQWRINNNFLEIVLGSNATAYSIIQNVEFFTGAQALNNNTNVRDITQNVTMGGVTKVVRFTSPPLVPLGNDDRKISYTTSNSDVGWYTAVNPAGSLELTSTLWGTRFTPKRNVYFEDTLNSQFVTLNIAALIPWPVNLTAGTAAGSFDPISVTSKFTRITPSTGETYASFKSRLLPRQYGIYVDSNNKSTVVINFGDLGDNGLTYNDALPNFQTVTADRMISRGYYGAADRDALINYYDTAYGAGNVTKGGVVSYGVYITERYDKVASDTTKVNTAKITKNGTTTSVSGQAVLQGNISTPANPRQAQLILSDEDTRQLLRGGTFKLQQKSNGNWVDYPGTGTLTTDVNGLVTTPTLSDGVYRFIQLGTSSPMYELSISQGYVPALSTVVSSEFTVVSSETAGHRVNVTNKVIRYTITYKKGTHGNFADNVNAGIPRGTNTPAYSGATGPDGNPLGDVGYVFAGWNTAVSPTVTGDATYTALWNPARYNVSYVLEGGTNNINNPATYEYGTGVLAFSDPVKLGYTFGGWKDATGNPFLTIAPTDTGDKTLYAHWTAERYNINYNLNGGANDSNNPINYDYGTGVPAFNNPTRMGYVFTGWTDENGNPITAISTTDTGDKTLNANWRAERYNVNYQLDGGTNNLNNPATYEYGVGVLGFADPTKVGYVFTGWTGDNGDPFLLISTTDMGDKTLHANWRAANYNVTYNLSGGTNDANNPATYEYGVGVASFGDPTKAGYVFTGWTDENGNPITAISTTATGDKTLNANWRAANYNVTYNLDGGTNDANNPATYEYGVGVASFGDPTKAGYVFTGWTDENGNPITAISTTATGDKTLYANWKMAPIDNQNNGDKSMPKTGDDSNLTSLIAAIIGCLIMLIFLVRKQRRRD